MNKIFLTDEEIEMFKSFREHQDEFMILKKLGIFDFKNGNMVIHKDETGIVRKVDLNHTIFKI